MNEESELIEALLQGFTGESSSFRLPSNLNDLRPSWPPVQPSPALEHELKKWETEKDAFPKIDASFSDSNKNSGAEVAATSAATPVELPLLTKEEASPKRWRCSHCAVEKTPIKRNGPEGRCTLCNACGIRFRTSGLVPEYRPANSPTFCNERHSNLSRAIKKMRMKSCSSSKENSFTK